MIRFCYNINMSYKICLDIGGTKIASALIDEKGRILHYQQIPSSARKCNKIIINNIILLIDNILSVETIHESSLRIHSINLSIAGQIDTKKGIIIKSPNFQKNFKNIYIKKILEKKFKLPVYIDNDANCFALGEAVYGLGKNYHYVVGMTLGSGVGGGIVINKKIYCGKNNLAGEFGHMFINNKLWEKQKKNIKNAQYLAQALNNILHVLDPEIIIIGGGISKVPKLINRARQKMNKLLYYQAFKRTAIMKSKLQERANLLGAYLLKK